MYMSIDCHSCRMKWLLKTGHLHKWSWHSLYCHIIFPACGSSIPVRSAMLHSSNNTVSLLSPVASHCLSTWFCFQCLLGQHMVLSVLVPNVLAARCYIQKFIRQFDNFSHYMYLHTFFFSVQVRPLLLVIRNILID